MKRTAVTVDLKEMYPKVVREAKKFHTSRATILRWATFKYFEAQGKDAPAQEGK